MFKIDPQLVSGFLSAISGLFSELKSQNIVKGRTILRMFREEIGDRSFEIITVEGIYSATAIVLDRTPKYLNRLKKKLRNFVYTFEMEYNEYLQRFSGVLDDFDSTGKLLDKYLGLALTTPLQINPDYRTEKISSDIDIYEIIRRESDQLAIGEGLFIEEIVNQCILDSNYNYREIIEAIISFLQQCILILVDQKRLLPSLSSQLLFDDEKEKERGKEELEADQTQEIPADTEWKEDSERSFEEIEEVNIEWFTEILSEITKTALPDSLKQDILERDIMFESEYRIKSSSIRTKVFSKPDLMRWAQLMTQKGFILQNKAKNPLSGLKITMKTDLTSIVGSIALLKNGDYLTVLAEVE